MANKLDQDDLWDSEGQRPLPSEARDTGQGNDVIPPVSRMERAKKLALSPDYPTPEIINALAEMLARHWYA